jgi:hypothetical protein
MSATLALHPLQGRVFRSPARFRVLVSGRRFGKTRLAIAELLSRVPSGGLIWYLAPTWDAARDICWRELKQWIPGGWLAKPPNETRLEVEFTNGARVQLKSAENADALRGRGLAFVAIDEYQDTDPMVWEDVIAPSLMDTRGSALFLGTPKSFNHLYDAYARGQAHQADWASWQFRSIDAAKPVGHLDAAEIERFRATLDERSFRQEFEASFEALSGRAYYGFVRADHVAPVALDPTWPVCLCFDFNIDPACAVVYQRFGENVRIWREAKTRHSGGEATRATARKVRDLLNGAGHRGEVRIYGDASGKSGKTTGPSDHAVLRELFGEATWCIPSANPHVRDRVSAVNSRLRSMTGARHLVVDPSCAGLIADFEQVIFANNGEIDKKSNPELTHLSDALGYGIARDFPVRSQAVAAIHGAREAATPSMTLQAIRAAKSASLRAQLEAAHHG